MTNFILIITCISAGIILSKLEILPKDSYKGVNAWLLNIALPAFALRFVPEIEWSIQMILPGISPIIVWVGAWIFVYLYGKKVSLDVGTKTALIVTCGLGNTAFLGFPMISAYYGEEQIQHAIMFDQTTFLLFSTIAVIVVLRATGSTGEKVTVVRILKKIFRFPPFLACVFALLASGWLDYSAAYPLLDKFFATLSPLALFSIGLQLKVSNWKQELPFLSAGLFYKLLLAPLLVLVFTFCMQVTGHLAKITVFEASMSSHITASLLASQCGMNPRLCSLMVAFGLIGGFITATLWWYIGELLL